MDIQFWLSLSFCKKFKTFRNVVGIKVNKKWIFPLKDLENLLNLFKKKGLDVFSKHDENSIISKETVLITKYNKTKTVAIIVSFYLLENSELRSIFKTFRTLKWDGEKKLWLFEILVKKIREKNLNVKNVENNSNRSIKLSLVNDKIHLNIQQPDIVAIRILKEIKGYHFSLIFKNHIIPSESYQQLLNLLNAAYCKYEIKNFNP